MSEFWLKSEFLAYDRNRYGHMTNSELIYIHDRNCCNHADKFEFSGFYWIHGGLRVVVK